MKTRVFKHKLYVLADHPGISGFKDWSRKVECIVTGHKAANNRSQIIREFHPSGGKYRVEDGHLPEYRPILSEPEALAWIAANPFQSMEVVA